MRCVLVCTLLIASTAHALPPGADPALRDGANHRVGDDSFVAAFGRAPTSEDAEKLRMTTHLVAIRAKLAAAPATRPALAARRAQLLGYLDDYIAKGITPVNEHLPWRTPVFIDDHGHVCAVGYLIERSVGRELPERIAQAHRYELLEEIAAAMPSVRAWVEGSGFTLDELASIQPGYEEPEVEAWANVNFVAMKSPDGAYEDSFANGVTKGALKKFHMEGAWTRTVDGKQVGKGTFSRGAGTWTSFYPDGTKLAQGAFVGDKPAGVWKLYHPSGNLAAIGQLARGYRSGPWQFYYDTKLRTPIAIGQFSGAGRVTGMWKHYDAAGRLLATSRPAGKGADPTSRGATLMSVVPGKDGVVHEIHAFGGIDSAQLHMIARGRERLYLDRVGSIYDTQGNLLTKDGDGWFAASCAWGRKRKAIAAAGDVATLHRLLHDASQPEEPPCGDKRAVSRARAASITATLGAFETVRAPSPAFVRELALGRTGMMADLAGAEDGSRTQDLVRVISASLSWFIEWPHVDGRFVALFATLPARALKGDIWTETRERNPDAPD